MSADESQSAEATPADARSKRYAVEESSPLTIEQYPTIGSIEEACRVLRTSRTSLLRLIGRGKLKKFKLFDGGSSKVRISKRELQRFIAAQDSDG